MSGGDRSADGRHSVHVRIDGRVQGVGFRDWARWQADKLGLRGWIRNRGDGSVEAVFGGRPPDVEEMLARCRNGPRSAMVSKVEVLGHGVPVPDTFEIRTTA